MSAIDREIGHTETNWKSLLPSSLTSSSLEVCNLLAERMSDYERVVTISENAKKQASMFFYWGGPSLGGLGALALTYLYLGRCLNDSRWEALAQTYLRMAAQATQQTPLLKPFVFDGSSGFAYIIAAFSRLEPRYQKTRDTLLANVAQQVLEHLWERQGQGVAMSDYDTIMGAAGILGLLVAEDSSSAITQKAIERLINYLIWLSGDNEQGRKRWFIPPELLPNHTYHKEYPEGYYNLGLAHGIPAPLAALSLAWKAGYHLPGQRETIEQLSCWIVERQVQDPWGINWPGGIPLADSFTPEKWRLLPPSRAAWCYGAPGIAASLWQAGDALADESLHQVALEAIEAVLKRPFERLYAFSPTLCHGMGGLLMIALRFAQHTNSQIIHAQIPVLVERILQKCSPDHPLGVQDEEQRGNFVDDPSFLTGAMGVALALQAAATTVEPEWDRLLLIA